MRVWLAFSSLQLCQCICHLFAMFTCWRTFNCTTPTGSFELTARVWEAGRVGHYTRNRAVFFRVGWVGVSNFLIIFLSLGHLALHFISTLNSISQLIPVSNAIPVSIQGNPERVNFWKISKSAGMRSEGIVSKKPRPAPLSCVKVHKDNLNDVSMWQRRVSLKDRMTHRRRRWYLHWHGEWCIAPLDDSTHTPAARL